MEVSKVIGWDAIGGICAVAALAWSYGSAGEQKRANFKSWISGRASSSAPAFRRVLRHLVPALLSIGAGWFCWHSIVAVAEFLVSPAPMTRREVFHLPVNLFNAIMYGGGALTFALLTFDRPKKPTSTPEGCLCGNEKKA
jgi:hypothetical protein